MSSHPRAFEVPNNDKIFEHQAQFHQRMNIAINKNKSSYCWVSWLIDCGVRARKVRLSTSSNLWNRMGWHTISAHKLPSAREPWANRREAVLNFRARLKTSRLQTIMDIIWLSPARRRTKKKTHRVFGTSYEIGVMPLLITLERHDVLVPVCLCAWHVSCITYCDAWSHTRGDARKLNNSFRTQQHSSTAGCVFLYSYVHGAKQKKDKKQRKLYESKEISERERVTFLCRFLLRAMCHRELRRIAMHYNEWNATPIPYLLLNEVSTKFMTRAVLLRIIINW